MNPGEQMPVLLYDGDCGLCNRVVRFLLRLDRGGRLRFAPLQSTAGQSYLTQHGLPLQDFDSLVFVPDWSRPERSDFLRRTDGALAALVACGELGREIAAVVALFPRSWRDAAYRGIARCRYRVFGQYHPTPLARPEWAARFLA